MHIICLKKNLKQALSAVGRIVGKNLTLPALNNLLLITERNRLKVSSTNLELGINYWIPCKIKAKGGITVPARLISEFVGVLPDKKIELKVKNKQLEIRCERIKANLKGIDAGDFPIIPKITEKPLIKIQAGVLRDALAQVVGMTAVSDARPGISGVFVGIGKKDTRLAATDSFRLAEKAIVLDLPVEKKISEKPLIVPQRTIQELIRIISESSDTDVSAGAGDRYVKIVLSDNQILFDMDYSHVISRLIEDKYPDYQQIIPHSSKTQVVVDRAALIDGVRMAGLFCGKVNDVKLVFDPSKKYIEVLSQNADIGENRSRIAAEIKGSKAETVFNYRYFLDGLGNIFSDKIVIGINDNVKPVVVRPVGDTSYTYVVCPIKE